MGCALSLLVPTWVPSTLVSRRGGWELQRLIHTGESTSAISIFLTAQEKFFSNSTCIQAWIRRERAQPPCLLTYVVKDACLRRVEGCALSFPVPTWMCLNGFGVKQMVYCRNCSNSTEELNFSLPYLLKRVSFIRWKYV